MNGKSKECFSLFFHKSVQECRPWSKIIKNGQIMIKKVEMDGKLGNFCIPSENIWKNIEKGKKWRKKEE
jgi:hypothetical protein